MTTWRQLKTNPELWSIFRLRAKIIDRIRQFFKEQNFLEIQTPLLAPALIPESYLEVFQTEIKNKLGKKQPAFLTPSPEIWHKKLLASASGNIFELTKSFRNTDLGGHFHNPEFTILEWYRLGKMKQTMADCENLIRFVSQKSEINYQGRRLNLEKPFEKISVLEAFNRYAKIDQKIFFDQEKLKNLAKKRGYPIKNNNCWETIYNLIYLKEVEPNLGREKPTFIYDFPAVFAPLAKPNPHDPRFKQRFELYLFGIELADGYQELTDPRQQEREFKKEISVRKKEGKINHPADQDFLDALKVGLRQCSGVALGVDRLIMIFANKTNIDSVILFAGNEIFGLNDPR